MFDLDEISKHVSIMTSKDIIADIKLVNIEQIYKLEKFLEYYKTLKHVDSEKLKDIEEIEGIIKNEISERNNNLQEADIGLRPTIKLSLDVDGNILLVKREHVDFETIYANSHALLKMYDDANNIEGIKYELCKIWMCKSLIDFRILYPKGIRRRLISEARRKKANILKSFIMNDMSKYLKVISKKEPDFNFQEYFNKTQFGIEMYKIDSRVIKASKIFLGVFK